MAISAMMKKYLKQFKVFIVCIIMKSNVSGKPVV